MDQPPIQFTHTSDGVSLAYWICGSGPPVIFCSGLVNSNIQLDWSLEWPRSINEVVASRCTMIGFDWRNTGLASRGVPFGPDEWYRDLEAIFQAVRPEPTSVVVYSDAAPIVWRYAATNPAFVDRLVVLQEGPPIANAGSIGHLGELIKGDPTWRRAVVRRLLGESVDQSRVRDWQEIHETSCAADYFVDASAAARRIDGTGFAARITAPTLVVYRRPYGVEAGTQLAAVIPGARLQLVDSDARLGPEPGSPLHMILDFVMASANGSVPAPISAPAHPPAPNGTSALSVREREILAHIACGASNGDIAEELCLSTRTVERHARNIYGKLGVHNRSEATAYAVRNGLA